jgi:hypothetical protein
MRDREAYEEYCKERAPSFGINVEDPETDTHRPDLWPHVHETYFFKVWDSDHPDLKLRAYNRFMVTTFFRIVHTLDSTPSLFVYNQGR